MCVSLFSVSIFHLVLLKRNMYAQARITLHCMCSVGNKKIKHSVCSLISNNDKSFFFFCMCVSVYCFLLNRDSFFFCRLYPYSEIKFKLIRRLFWWEPYLFNLVWPTWIEYDLISNHIYKGIGVNIFVPRILIILKLSRGRWKKIDSMDQYSQDFVDYKLANKNI